MKLFIIRTVGKDIYGGPCVSCKPGEAHGSSDSLLSVVRAAGFATSIKCWGTEPKSTPAVPSSAATQLVAAGKQHGHGAALPCLPLALLGWEAPEGEPGCPQELRTLKEGGGGAESHASGSSSPPSLLRAVCAVSFLCPVPCWCALPEEMPFELIPNPCLKGCRVQSWDCPTFGISRGGFGCLSQGVFLASESVLVGS